MSADTTTSIKACNRFGPVPPAILAMSSATVQRARINESCPVHDSDACVETYVPEGELARLTWLEFLALRRVWRDRAARRAAVAHEDEGHRR